MKKTIATLLALCLLLMGSLALAEQGDAVWLWDEFSDGVYVEGTLQGDVTIPASINEHAAYALQFSALCDQNSVTSLTLPDTMYVLQEAAVANMTGLESVTLNEGLEVIDNGNFSRCPALTSVTVPASVKMIISSFQQCDSLREIRFTGVCPTFVDTGFAFWWLPDDYVIYVPDDQYDAYAAALADANGAADHLQSSGQNAVICDTKAADDWFVFDAAAGAITGYTQYHPFVEIPQSIGGVAVKSIADEAMRGETCIYGLVLPEGLEQVGKRAFDTATNLSYIKLPSTLKAISDDAFNYVPGLKIDWSEGLETIGARAFKDIRGKSLTLPSTVKTIGEGAFESAWLQEVYLGTNVESIGPRAFADCQITYMAFDLYAPIDIAADAFVGNNATADLDLPWDSSLENHAAYVELFREQFPTCTVWINNPMSSDVAETPETDVSITTFDNGVWTVYKGDKPNLTTWPLFNDIQVTALGDGVFKGSQTIRSFYPHHCFWFTTIGNEAFADSTVEYVELFDSITTIGNGAFRNCLNLKELTLPASLTSIGADTLAGCDNLQTLTVLCDPSILPDGLLDECFAHTEIYAAPNATAEQVRILSEKAHRPWYAPVSRLGEPANDLTEMPYAMFVIDDFWYDTEYARLDRYHGSELNLYLPREAEGMTLNTIGGDMMGRARGGDNYGMELPVRSVVIPENYTSIAFGAFANCETLETVICYAPLETVYNSMFDGCTNLREVVFVNGVRSVESYAFNGCTSLETVYVGPYVETIGENSGFSSYITDPALMPDVEALLTAVKSDPVAEPTPAPAAAPAAPVGEEGAAFVGTWKAVTMEMEGEAFSVADLGAEMTLTLNADGTAENFDGETTSTDTWSVANGAVVMTDMLMTMDAEGRLVMEMDGMKLFFEKDGGAPAAPVAPAAPSADASAYLGTWTADILEMDGETYPVAAMGMEMHFTLNADGTAESFDGESNEAGTWTLENGVLTIAEMPMTMDAEGRLIMAEDGMKLIFVKDDGAAPAVPAVPAAPEADASAYLGTWTADTLEMDGEVYSVTEMGMYFIVNADGTVESFDGETGETATWVLENGVMLLEGVPVTLEADGRLLMADEESRLFFVKGDGAAPAVPAAPEAPAADSGDSDLSSRMDIRYVCVNAETGGITMDASMLGGEYSLTLHADGTADFVMVGTPVPGLSWTQNGSTITVDYYGTPMVATLTDEGIDLNFFDSMMLHLVPAE